MGTEGNGTCKREEIDALDSCVLFISLRAYRCVFILHDRIQSDKKMLEIATSADDGGAKEGGKEGNTVSCNVCTIHEHGFFIRQIVANPRLCSAPIFFCRVENIYF